MPWASGFTLFHFLVDLLMDILAYSRPQIRNIESIKGLDGLAEVYKVGTI